MTELLYFVLIRSLIIMEGRRKFTSLHLSARSKLFFEIHVVKVKFLNGRHFMKMLSFRQ